MDDKTYEAQIQRKGECNHCPGHLCWMDPAQLDWEGFEESEETCLSLVASYFQEGKKLKPPKSWPEKCSIPIRTLQTANKPKVTEGHVRLLYSGLVRAYWYAVYLLLEEEPSEFDVAIVPKCLMFVGYLVSLNQTL